MPTENTSKRGALTGIRVIELADEQAEYCGLTLAGLGADVIKVEPPGGNSTRRIGPFYQDQQDPERSLFFWQYNRGKRSVAIDLDSDEGRAWLDDRLAGSDVLLRTGGPEPGLLERQAIFWAGRGRRILGLHVSKQVCNETQAQALLQRAIDAVP